MTPELKFKHQIVDALRAREYHAQFHEDKHERFIPDVSFAGWGVDGWIEVKYIRSVQPTVFNIDHYTAGQRDWLVKRASVGRGWCFLLVGWPGGWALWKAPHLPVNGINWGAALAYAVAHCPSTPLTLAGSSFTELAFDLTYLITHAPRIPRR